MTPLHASIIVPSYNGKDKVIKLLKSLEQQTCLTFEVVVVVDGSTDGTAKALKVLDWKLPSLRVIETQNNGRAGARNTGAQEAKYNVLIFFDDDMFIDATCVEQHLLANTFQSKRIVMGQVIEPSSSADNEIKKYKDYLNKSWSKKIDLYKQQNLPTDVTFLSAQNFSISKNLFTELEGFNQNLKDVEDYDLALRAKSKHIPVYYLDTALAIHCDYFSFHKYALRSKDYLKNRMLAAKLNPALYSKDPILTHKNSTIQKIVYPFLKHTFWLTLFDSFNIFTYILPKNLRYKLYGVVITAHIQSQQK